MIIKVKDIHGNEVELDTIQARIVREEYEKYIFKEDIKFEIEDEMVTADEDDANLLKELLSNEEELDAMAEELWRWNYSWATSDDYEQAMRTIVSDRLAPLF